MAEKLIEAIINDDMTGVVNIFGGRKISCVQEVINCLELI